MAATPRGLSEFPELLGATAAIFGICFGIAYALKGRRKIRDWNGVGQYFFWIALFVPGVQRAQHPQRSVETADQWVGRLTREATGKSPIQGDSNDAESVLMRGILHEQIALAQRYAEQTTAKFDAPEIKHIYAASSFRDRTTEESTLRQLREISALVEQFDSDLAQSRESIERRVSSSGWSASEVASFSGPFEEGIRNTRNVLFVEKKWLGATEELHEFVLKNFRLFSVRGQQVYISDGEVLKLFNAKLGEAQQLQSAYVLAFGQINQNAKAIMKKEGIAETDLEKTK